MNTPTGNCCEACKDNIPFMKCNRTCSCHTSPTTIVTPERVANAVHDSLDELYSPTDWRERFREKWEKDTKFVGPKIESFIESEIASAIERTVKTASEMQFKMNVDDYLPLVKKWDGKNFDVPFQAGYEQFRKDLIAQLSPSQSE